MSRWAAKMGLVLGTIVLVLLIAFWATLVGLAGTSFLFGMMAGLVVSVAFDAVVRVIERRWPLETAKGPDRSGPQ